MPGPVSLTEKAYSSRAGGAVTNPFTRERETVGGGTGQDLTTILPPLRPMASRALSNKLTSTWVSRLWSQTIVPKFCASWVST